MFYFILKQYNLHINALKNEKKKKYRNKNQSLGHKSV